jgi:hypothetical protein
MYASPEAIPSKKKILHKNEVSRGHTIWQNQDNIYIKIPLGTAINFFPLNFGSASSVMINEAHS